MEPLALLDAGLRGMVLSLLAVLALVLWRERGRLHIAWVGLALCLGLGVQIVSSAPLVEALVSRYWQAPLIAISLGNGVLFWLLVRALLEDDFALRPTQLLWWLAVVFISCINCVVSADHASPLAPWTMLLVRATPLLFACLAALVALRHWRSDLVENRRRLRASIVFGGIAYILASLAVRVGSAAGGPSSPAALGDVLMLLAIVGMALPAMIRLNSSDLLYRPDCRPKKAVATETAGAAPLPPADAADDELAALLQRRMHEDQLYRSGELTVASLAALLDVPEYRLRRLINQRLGHRNFNAYINEFRLKDACTSLADPAQSAMPVLSIALTSGFQSIGPFNRAFKALTGLTPTEYRKENMADS